jgi:hypothetical protein
VNQLRQLMLEELRRRNFADTTIYRHLSQRQLSATASPLDALTFSAQGGHKHSS